MGGRKYDRNKRIRGKEILKVKEMWKGTNKNDRNKKKGQVVTSYSSESKRQIQEKFCTLSL